MRVILTCVAVLLFALVSLPAYAGYRAVVDKSEQHMYVFKDGVEIYRWPASTGLKSSYTPVGTYRFYKFARVHTSYPSGKSMNWAVYYRDGQRDFRAVHATDPSDAHGLGRVGTSLGCTHLSDAHAEIFFRLVEAEGLRNVPLIIQE